jgi:hypothetical protein
MAMEVYATNEELLQDILNCFSEEDIKPVVRAWCLTPSVEQPISLFSYVSYGCFV